MDEMEIKLFTLMLVVHCSLAFECENGQFFNIDTKKCQICSTCPDQLLSRTCGDYHDSICGIGEIKFTFLDASSDVKKVHYKEIQPVHVLQNKEETYWKSLAFSLIAVLTVLVILASVAVIMACYRFRNYPWLCKQVAPDQDDTENGYVIIHSFVPPESSVPAGDSSYVRSSSEQTYPSVSFQNRNIRFNGIYKPKRRLIAEYVDDVFESDDSGGSRSLRLPLETIPEKFDGSSSPKSSCKT